MSEEWWLWSWVSTVDTGFIVVSTSRSAILDLQGDFLAVVVDSEFFCFESFFAWLSVVGLLIEVLGRSSTPPIGKEGRWISDLTEMELVSLAFWWRCLLFWFDAILISSLENPLNSSESSDVPNTSLEVEGSIMTLQSRIYYCMQIGLHITFYKHVKQDCRKAEPCRSLAGMRSNEKRQPLHMRRGSWYGLHQYEATESNRITWEHAGNKGAFGNAAYVTLT